MVIAEVEALLVEGWIISENSDWVVVNLEATSGGFENDAGASGIGNIPVEFGSGKLLAKRKIAEVEALEESFNFINVSAASEEPGKKFELSDIVFAFDIFVINGVSDEVESSNTETFFVDGVI